MEIQKEMITGPPSFVSPYEWRTKTVLQNRMKSNFVLHPFSDSDEPSSSGDVDDDIVESSATASAAATGTDESAREESLPPPPQVVTDVSGTVTKLHRNPQKRPKNEVFV